MYIVTHKWLSANLQQCKQYWQWQVTFKTPRFLDCILSYIFGWIYGKKKCWMTSRPHFSASMGLSILTSGIPSASRIWSTPYTIIIIHIKYVYGCTTVQGVHLHNQDLLAKNRKWERPKVLLLELKHERAQRQLWGKVLYLIFAFVHFQFFRQ